MISFLSTLLIGFFLLGSGYHGDDDLHRELSREAKKERWQIVTGGNNVYRIDIKNRKKTLIMSDDVKNDYVWGMVGLSFDGEWLALLRGTWELNTTELVLINWRKFLRAPQKFRELVQLPLPDFDVKSFTWAPDRHVLAIQARKRHAESQNPSRRPFKVYEFSIERRGLELLPIEQINNLEPHAWSLEDLLIYKSEDNTIEMAEAQEEGRSLPKISILSAYDFNSGKVIELFQGDFPTWNRKGILTFLDSPTDALAVLAPPMHPNERHHYKDHFYSYNPSNRERKLFLENKHPRGKNGSIFGPLIWSPDDRYVMYGRQTGFTGSFKDLYVMEVSSGRETLICRGVDREASWVALEKSTRS